MSKKHLGIDYGEERVGIALSDESGMMAFPKEVLQNDRTLLERVCTIIKDEQISAIVLGESKNYKGEPNPIMEDISDFKKTLEEKFCVPVYLEPEYMTSAQATHLQGEHDKIDASAAAIILQSFLDKNSSAENNE